MRHRISLGIAVAAALWTTAAPAQIVDMGKFPDWAGQWRRAPDGGPLRYDPSKPNGLGQQAPLTPEAQAKLVASLKDQEAGGQGLDQTYKCIPTGMPRMMSGVFPHEFVFTPDTTFMLFEFMINASTPTGARGRTTPAIPRLSAIPSASGSIPTATAAMTSSTWRRATSAALALSIRPASRSPTTAKPW
jgi:hypothetical protein